MNNIRGDGVIRPHPLELRERGYQLYKAGKSHAKIAAEIAVPVSTVGGWSSKGKWRIRLLAEAGEKNTGAPQSSGNQAIAYENFTLTEAQDRYEALMQVEALKFAEELSNMPPALKLASADKIEKRDKVARKALKLETEKPRMLIHIGLLAGGNVPDALPKSCPNNSLTLTETAGNLPVADATTGIEQNLPQPSDSKG